MKKPLKISLTAIGFILLLLVIVWLTFISPPKIIFQIGLPDIAKDLPSNFADADEEFNQRVQAKYTDGMSVIDLTEQLKEEGFDVDTGGFAQITKSKFPCTFKWQVTWTNDIAARATNIKGNYGGSCL